MTTAGHAAAIARTPDGRTRFLSLAEQQQLITENLSEVLCIARRIHLRLPPHVPLDDLVHSGVLGLMDALEKFDPGKNVPLKSYAQFRIRGAILDSLRQLDWSPRSLRRQARRIEQAHGQLTSELRRTPSVPEIAAYLGFPLDKLQDILTELHTVSAATQPEEFIEREFNPASQSETPSKDPFNLCFRAEMTAILAEAIDALAPKERQALVLYYLEEHTMKEVGMILNIGESRVSQIVAAAVTRLRLCVQKRLNGRPSQDLASACADTTVNW
jgi:RNA polymerase sigma factor for flagellar operon FliA